jgi:hypothetical protein
MTSSHICKAPSKSVLEEIEMENQLSLKSSEFEYVLKAKKFTSENDDVVNENEDSEMNKEE